MDIDIELVPRENERDRMFHVKQGIYWGENSRLSIRKEEWGKPRQLSIFLPVSLPLIERPFWWIWIHKQTPRPGSEWIIKT